MSEATRSNLKQSVSTHYEVQRRRKSGKWVRVHPPRKFGTRNHGLGLQWLREFIWAREHRKWPWKKPSHNLGDLRVVRVKVVKTEQRFYEPTDIKPRQRKKNGRWVGAR